MPDLRVGSGFDVHRLVENRKLILGGIHIPFEKGLLGHSDADVLLHAICDALLGALALGDIGIHFPDSSPQYKDIDSSLLLRKSYELVQAEGYHLINLDATIILQKPRVKDYIPEMREHIAALLKVPVSAISVKATTTEKLGFTGREEGVAAEAVVLAGRGMGD